MLSTNTVWMPKQIDSSFDNRELQQVQAKCASGFSGWKCACNVQRATAGRPDWWQHSNAASAGTIRNAGIKFHGHEDADAVADKSSGILCHCRLVSNADEESGDGLANINIGNDIYAHAARWNGWPTAITRPRRLRHWSSIWSSI